MLSYKEKMILLKLNMRVLDSGRRLIHKPTAEDIENVRLELLIISKKIQKMILEDEAKNV